MSMLPYPTCPSCGQKIDLSYLYSKCSQDRNGVFKDGPIGIGCPHCRQKLRVRQFWEIFARSVMTAVLAICFALILIRFQSAAAETINALMFLFLVVALLVVGMGSKYRRFAQLVRIESNDISKVRFPLEKKPQDLTQAEIEERQAEQETFDWSMKNRLADEEGPAWRCPKCKEENAASFEVCWKCGHERIG